MFYQITQTSSTCNIIWIKIIILITFFIDNELNEDNHSFYKASSQILESSYLSLLININNNMGQNPFLLSLMKNDNIAF